MMPRRSGLPIGSMTEASSKYINITGKVSLLSTSDVMYKGELYGIGVSERSIALKDGKLYILFICFVVEE